MPRVALTMLLAALLCGCAAIMEEETEDRPGGKADDGSDACPVEVDYEWVEGGENLTDRRVASLNEYAKEKLRSRQCEIDKTLAWRGASTEDPPNIADLYRVQVGNRLTCMNGDFLFADFDLESDRHYRDMKDQVDMTIEFLKRFHEDANGIPTVILDTITICPKKAFGDEFALHGPNLYVNVPFSQFGWISTMDARELRNEKWTRGEHLCPFPKAELLKLIWPLFDPVGSARTALRNGIADRVKKLIARLINFDGVVSNPNVGLESARSVLDAMVEDHASDSVDNRNGEPLMESALGEISTADRARLECVARTWKAYIEDPERWTATGEAAVATVYKEASRNALNVKVKQNGKIVIGNTHFVNVNLDLFLSSGYQDLERYVEVVEVEQNIDWEQNGFFVIYTVDNIDVNVSVSVNRALQSAGLEQALRSCN